MANITTTDAALLALLQSNARLTNKAMAELVGVSPSTALERVRDLERRGVIRGYHAELDLGEIGHRVQAMVRLRIHPKTEASVERVVDRLQSLPETLNVFLLSGDDDVLVHVSVADTESLRRLVLTEIASQEGVVDENTSLVFEHRRRTVIDVTVG